MDEASVCGNVGTSLPGLSAPCGVRPGACRVSRSVLARVVQVAGGDTVTAIAERSTKLRTQRENLEEIQRHRRKKAQ